MPPVLSAVLAFVASFLQSRQTLHLRILALQYQVAVYKQTVARPRLRPTDRLFWAWLSRLWPAWQSALAFVQPRTVIAWQHKRFREHWRRLSQRGTPGRPALAKEIRDLIRQMWQANPTWGSPRIVGELRTLGIEVAKSTVEKYRPRPKKPLSPTWKTFLKNHVQDLVAMDFFVVPTVTFRVLFVLVILAHDRRRIVHFNVTEHPTAQWTAQQVVEAFPWDEAPRYLLRDPDRISYGQITRKRETRDHSGSPALSHQQSAQLHAFLRIEIQKSCCGATFRSDPLDVPIVSQLKVGVPALLARMKQRYDVVDAPGFRVCGGDVGPLFQVAAQATQAEIALLIGPQVLLGDNMVDLMR